MCNRTRIAVKQDVHLLDGGSLIASFLVVKRRETRSSRFDLIMKVCADNFSQWQLVYDNHIRALTLLQT